MKAKIGIIYTGKKLESETSKIKRYALENKTVYADIVDSDVFGKNMSYLGEENILPLVQKIYFFCQMETNG